MNIAKTTLSSTIVLAGAVLACGGAHAAPACDPVSQIQRRIVERSDGDAAALRIFVGRITMIYGIDMFDVRENLEKWRAAVECRRQMAQAGDAPTRVAQR